MAYKVIHNAAV